MVDMIQKYYKCTICAKYKAIDQRARKYCTRSCRAKAYYLTRGKARAKAKRKDARRLAKARAWAKAR